jgi:hypothetical protein
MDRKLPSRRAQQEHYGEYWTNKKDKKGKKKWDKLDRSIRRQQFDVID